MTNACVIRLYAEGKISSSQLLLPTQPTVAESERIQDLMKLKGDAPASWYV